MIPQREPLPELSLRDFFAGFFAEVKRGKKYFLPFQFKLGRGTVIYLFKRIA